MDCKFGKCDFCGEERPISIVKHCSACDTKDKIEKYKEALIWCSGSDDFQVGGKARVGWEKLCIPLLK